MERIDLVHRTFDEIERDPFAFVKRLTGDPRMKQLPAVSSSLIADLTERILAAVTSEALTPRRTPAPKKKPDGLL